MGKAVHGFTCHLVGMVLMAVLNLSPIFFKILLAALRGMQDLSSPTRD